VIIHWAADDKEHNEIVLSILKKHNAKELIKSKSMLTEECHLNAYLAKEGIDVIDTDLGERIVQLADESPSHIVLPCIHWKKEEIGNLFTNTLVHLREMQTRFFNWRCKSSSPGKVFDKAGCYNWGKLCGCRNRRVYYMY
jgi:L-lactate utilization protein LutB